MQVGGKSKASSGEPAPPPVLLPYYGESSGASWSLLAVPPADLVALFGDSLELDPAKVLAAHAAALAGAVEQLKAVEAAGLELALRPVDPAAELKINDYESLRLFEERAAALRAVGAAPCHKCKKLEEQFALVNRQLQMCREVVELKHRMSDAALQQMPDYETRVRVLERLSYVDGQQTVAMKGKVACEIQSADELLATELIFSGLLGELDECEAIAVLSALIFQEKTDNRPEGLPAKLVQAQEELTAMAWSLGELQQGLGLPTSPDDYVRETLNWGLVEVVYEWARGVPFAEICGFTDVMEGSIVRTIVRLDETCREFRDAARVMGDAKLFKQMQAASLAIKRDVVFAGSLYVV